MLTAVTVGFCEEVIYRGYLQTQLTAFTGRASIAVVLQAALFGIAHGEQGLAVVVRFTLYGVLFGGLARWRRSLLPGIAAHIGQVRLSSVASQVQVSTICEVLKRSCVTSR